MEEVKKLVDKSFKEHSEKFGHVHKFPYPVYLKN